MDNTRFNDRIEKKYEIDIAADEVAALCADLSSFLSPYGLAPVQDITSVGSVYFDNRHCDLLRSSLFGRLMLVRVRAYELYYRHSEPITEFWVETKTAEAERRSKRRFRLPRSALPAFLEGNDVRPVVFEYNNCDADENVIRFLYRDAQETILNLGLEPILLVVYKRVAFQSEVERLSIDWDVRHYLSTNPFNYSSWKYLDEPAAGKSDNVIVEIKYLQGGIPPWFSQLQQNYPIRRREYLKPVEGMGYLFQGPLKYHKEANFFLPLISAYQRNSRLG